MSVCFGSRKRKRKSRVTIQRPNSNDDEGIPASSQHNSTVVEGLSGQSVTGSIIRITMKNFLTYDYSVVCPGPKLNMILGANGTGKSSIVCAICLGLAGKPIILGRGDKVGFYVKRGCNKGFIEIELFKNGGNVVIKREIHMETNLSVWTLNGRQSSLKAVEEEVKALQIQVSNLCQFLPQDKVGEFSKMSKVDLLEATEKSVGPPEMYQYHCDLKNFRSKERELEVIVKEKGNFLDRTKQRYERIKLDVNRYYEKKRHLDMIELLEKKKPWLEYETGRQDLDNVKKKIEDSKKQLSMLRKAQAPKLKEIQIMESRLKPIEEQINAKTAAMKKASVKCKQEQDRLDQKHKEIEDIKQDLRLKQTDEEDHRKRIGNTTQIIEDLKVQLANLSDQPDVVPLIDAVSTELRRKQTERAQVEGERADVQRERDNCFAESRMLAERLSNMKNMLNAKEEKLRGRHIDTHKAVQWLRKNRHMFSGNVYEPMMLVINVKDHRFAKYVENHIPFKDLRAFVFQRQDDREKFMTEVRDRMNLKVNSIFAPGESSSKWQPSRPMESLKRFGFVSYLRELFEAPNEVMCYLCQQYKVHDVPVGTAQTRDMIKTVIKEPYIKILYTAEERYVVKKSFYSNKISTSNSTIHPSQYLIITVDAEEKHKVEQQINACEVKLQGINECMRTLEQQATKLEQQDNELREEKKRLSEMKAKKRQLEQKISTKQDSLRLMEQSGIDLKMIEEQSKAKISAVNSQKVAIVTEFLSQMKMRTQLSMEKVSLALEMVGLTAKKNKLRNDCSEGATELKQMEEAHSQLEQRKSQMVMTCKSLLKKACEICNVDPKAPIPVELQTALIKLPDTVDAIDDMLNKERARAECFTGLSENIVEEYNQRQQEIQNLEKELENVSNDLNAHRQKISEANKIWLNPLKELVDKINENFTDFFRSMNCVGEVDLHTENEEEYDKYGIRIRVQFHSSTKLRELTPNHQSGGERSVSTMLYLMALQELNRCPFRVVDEINQGMDPVNERRVFDIVVRTACKETTSQYFFVTPKLLQNLSYSEEMNIIIVHNGPNMLSPDKWDEKAFLRRYARRKRMA